MTLKELLNRAYKEKFAVGGFGVYNLESARAVIQAANKTQKPVFLMMTEKSLDYAGFENLVEIVTRLKKESKIPVFMHLDHGSNIEVVKNCISSGFDSVMFDGSKLPLDQNIHISRDLRKIAHKKGVIYEAEIGQIGGKEDYVRSSEFKTNPSEALQFYNEVQPDMLAVAIGNIHGELTADEQLDFTLLGKI
jgi:fructose-bisphosphate aldolase class II